MITDEAAYPARGDEGRTKGQIFARYHVLWLSRGIGRAYPSRRAGSSLDIKRNTLPQVLARMRPRSHHCVVR